MRVNSSVPVIVASLFVATAVVIISLPLRSGVVTNRQRIDTARAALQRLQQQQSNIAEVSRDYDSIRQQLVDTETLFVGPTQTVDLFNRLDALVGTAGLTAGNVRLDTPNGNAAPQLLGIHLTATGTRDQLASLLRSTGTLPYLLVPQTIALTPVKTATVAESFTATIDGVVGWDPTPLP